MLIKRFISFFLLAIICIMSSGASVNAHYCKDKMVDWAFFKKAKACKMKPAAISANINKEKDYIT